MCVVIVLSSGRKALERCCRQHQGMHRWYRGLTQFLQAFFLVLQPSAVPGTVICSTLSVVMKSSDPFGPCGSHLPGQ